MKERPIIFSGAMVRTVLGGSKTQTRRVCKAVVADDGDEYRDADGWPFRYDDGTAGDVRAGCPYGARGDILWVRETWIPLTFGYGYRADPIWNAPLADRWRPSIHMPRAASRITLAVTDVRVERLSNISVYDCRAEGGQYHSPVDVRAWYRDTWESIHGPGSWDANPWVWAISFKMITP